MKTEKDKKERIKKLYTLEKIEKELDKAIKRLQAKRSFLIEHKFEIERQFIQNRIDALEDVNQQIRGLNKGWKNIEEVNFDRL